MIRFIPRWMRALYCWATKHDDGATALRPKECLRCGASR